MIHEAKLSAGSLVSCFPVPDEIPVSGALFVIVSGNEVAVTTGDKPTILSEKKPAGSLGPEPRVQYL
ncbi:MAG: hypothetical protein WC620_05240 [Methanoregula sp.]|jgi:hypothetical protein